MPESPHLFSHYPSLPPARDVPLTVVPAHPCAYFPDRQARTRAFYSWEMGGEVYQDWMDAAFRRSGRIVYQPICAGCRRCVPIRVPLASFKPDKSQRRCVKRNADLIVNVELPFPTDEKLALYQTYQSQRHGSEEDNDPTSFVDFLYNSPTKTVEFTYRDAAGRLLAVGICDLTPSALSSVYFYFDPAEARRGLGTFGALREIEYATAHGLAHYYLGYWVEGSARMQYKASFRPFELLYPDGVWRPVGIIRSGNKLDNSR